MGKLVEVFSSPDTSEAQLVAVALRHHGISPTVLGADLAALAGMGRIACPARVMVREQEADEARAAVAVLQASLEDPGDLAVPDTCPSCDSPWEPGFVECWQCQHPLPA